MKRSLLLVLPLLAAAFSAPAHAACPVEGCGGGGTVVTHPTVTLTVAAPSRGTIVDDNGKINCGSDCTENYIATRTCVDADCTTTGPAVTLTGNGGSGFSPSWSGCDSANGATCSITMDSDHTVSVAWTDVQDPTVALSSPPAKIGPNSVITAAASDNGVVSKVDFYVDDVLAASDTSAPYQFAPNVGPLADGSSHTLKAVAQDGVGRRSGASSANVTVDKSTSLTGVSVPAAFVKAAPDVAFAAPADAAHVTCTTATGGTTVGSTATCTSPYTPQGITADGQYDVTISATDDVGNTASVVRSFTLDRGAPTVTVTAPSDNAILSDPFTPAATGTDASGAVTIDCRLDAGAYGPCAALAPADGTHTVTVRGTDAAGNTAEVARHITYDTQAPVVTITKGPAEGATVTADAAGFAYTTSDLTTVTVTCTLDGSACAPGQTLDPGAHTFTLRADDAAGHTTTVTRHFTVIDVAAPPPTATPTKTPVPTVTPTSTTAPAPTTTATPTVTVSPTTTATPAPTAALHAAWKVHGKRTRVRALILSGVAAGQTVTITCKGKGCPFKTKTLTGTGKDLELARRFGHRKLRPRTVITVTVGTQRFRYTLRAGKAPKAS